MAIPGKIALSLLGMGFGSFPALALCQEAPATLSELPTFFVSTTGNDSNSGASPDQPFRTLVRAAAAIEKQGGGTVIVSRGKYSITAPVTIERTAHPQHWQSDGRADATIDGEYNAPSAIVVKSNDVTIMGFTVEHFTQSGIIINGGKNVRILGNTIRDIRSSAWSQAAVLALENAPGLLVKNNKIERVRYSAIAAVASARGNLQDIEISANTISMSCTGVSDCGAIYVSGRTSLNGGIIKNNKIGISAPSSNLASAIYLDDMASNFEVRENDISGHATTAFHIHGGRNINLVRNRSCSGIFQMPLKIQDRGGIAPVAISMKYNDYCNLAMIKDLENTSRKRRGSLEIIGNK